MEQSATKLTNDYINSHPYIKSCLKKDLINYSSLARLVAKDLGIEKKTSKEAILIAARRFQDKLKADSGSEKDIRSLFSKTEIEMKNKVMILILEKNLDLEYLDEVNRKIRKESGTFFLLEGSDNYTLITQEKYADLIERRFKSKIIKTHRDTLLVTFKSPKEIEVMPGAISYFTSLFAENGVNILEFISCWTDTLFIIESKDANKVMGFLRF